MELISMRNGKRNNLMPHTVVAYPYDV